jgi:hypothetical protein
MRPAAIGRTGEEIADLDGEPAGNRGEDVDLDVRLAALDLPDDLVAVAGGLREPLLAPAPRAAQLLNVPAQLQPDRP